MIKITKQQEWTEYSIIECGPFSFSLNFRNLFQSAALLIAVWWAYETGLLAAEMQVAQTAYLYHGLKEDILGSHDVIMHYCSPMWVNGSVLNNWQPYVGWDCHSEVTKETPLTKLNNSIFNLTGDN